MTTTCESLIAQDIIIPCEDQVTKGLEGDGLIINRDDIDFTKSVVAGNIIKTLVLMGSLKDLGLQVGKKAYAIRQEGSKPFTGTKTELTVGTYRNSWKNTVAVVVLANTPDVCANIIDGLANGKFVIILRNLSKGADGNAEYQVFGYAQALKASAGENDKYSDDTEGGWLITLEEESVPKAAYFFFDTDSETTAAKYKSLLTEAAA